MGIFCFIPLGKKRATQSWGSYVLNAINCYFRRGIYKNHIGLPALYSQIDYLDKLRRHIKKHAEGSKRFFLLDCFI